MFMKITANRTWIFLLFLMIAAGNIFIYFPSFSHMPRADHLFYLADMAYKQDWVSLAIQSFDWSRSRTFAPGDYLIFRPGAYFLMGSEKFFFGYNFVLWQVTGLVMHLIIIGMLLRLLLNIGSSLFAVMMAGYFSFLFMNMETVVWHAINSILLAMMMTLMSLNQIWLYQKGKCRETHRLMIASAGMTVAALTYEISVVLSGLFFVYLFLTVPWKGQGRWRSLWLLIPPAIFTVTSAYNYVALGYHRLHPVKGAGLPDLVQIVKNTFLTMGWWIYSAFFPGKYEIIHVLGRAELANRQDIFPAMGLGEWQLWLGTLFVLCWGLLAVRSGTWEFIKKRLGFLALLLGMALGWAAVISSARVQERGVAFALGGTVTYHYIIWCFLVVFMYSAVNFEALPSDRLTRAIKCAFIILIVGQMLHNGRLVYSMNRRISQWYAPSRELVKAVESMIMREGDQPGFSFYIDYDFPGNFLYPYRLREQDPITKRYSFAEMIYLNYFDDENPMFVFVSARHDGTPRIIRMNQEKRRGGSPLPLNQ